MGYIIGGTHQVSTPGLMYELYADQTGGSGTSRTIKLTLKLKCAGSSSSWYGFPMNWRGYVNGTWSGWMSAKGTESWRGSDGWRSYTWSYTTNVGTTSSKSIQVGFQTDSYSGDNDWDTTKYGNFTVGSTNTAPTMSGAITTKYRIAGGPWTLISSASDGPENQIKIPETADYIRCEWNPGSDDKGEGNLTYYLTGQQSESSWAAIANGRDKFYEHNIGAGNEGRSYDYGVYCKDSDGAQSNTIDGLQFQKNEFTTATGSSSNTIEFNSPAITIRYSGAKNTSGSTSFTYSIETGEADVKIYNGGSISTGGSQEIKIHRSGTAPTVPYISFSELKKKYESSAYKGNLRVVLKTKNAYGTIKTSEFSIPINLQIAPIGVKDPKVDLGGSTAYVTVVNKKFLVPDTGRSIRVVWNAGSAQLGEPVSYEVYSSLDSGKTFTKIAAIDSNTLQYSHTVSKLAAKGTIRYRVRIKNDFGLYSDVDTPDYVLHYVNEPTISVEDTIRASTEFSFYVQVKTPTSLTSNDVEIQTVGSWETKTKDGSSRVSNGSLTSTQNRQKVTVTNLTDDGQYTTIITYNDNTGLNKAQPQNVSISANSPIVFLNKYGLGIGGSKADANYALRVKGNTNIEGTFHVNGKPVSVNIDTSKFLTNTGPTTFKSGQNDVTGFTIAGPQQELHMWTGTGGSVIQNRKGVLYLGVADNYTNFAIKPEGVFLGRDLTVNQYLKVNAWSGYGSGTSNIWFDGNSRTLTFGNTDVFKTDDTGTWKSVDLIRSGGRTRYGIGQNDPGPSPSIEFWEAGKGAYTARMNIIRNAIQLYANDTPSCWMGFYSGSTRQGYIGRGSNGDSIFRVYAETGDLILSTNYRIQATGHFHAGSDNTFYLGLTNPAGRWKQLCAVSSSINTSDHRYKEDIKPIMLSARQTFSEGDYNEKPYAVQRPRYGSPTSEDYYNFVKNDLQLYEYNYITPYESIKGLSPEQQADAQQGAYTIGFIADDYQDTPSAKVANQFIFRSSDGVLNYNTGNYVNVLANALKVALLKIENLENELQKKLDKPKKM